VFIRGIRGKKNISSKLWTAFELSVNTPNDFSEDFAKHRVLFLSHAN